MIRLSIFVLHKLAKGLDTSYDNIIPSSSYTVNGKRMRIE